MSLFKKAEQEINPTRLAGQIFLFLLGAELLIVLADIFLYQLEWLPWSQLRIPFNITREDTVVNWFSSMQAFAAALVLLAIFLLARRQKRAEAWGWGVLAVIFAAISLDDGAKLHERAGSSVVEMANHSPLIAELASNFPSYYWQMVCGPLLIAVGVFMTAFLWRNSGKTTFFYCFVIAACFLAFAILLDFVEGMDVGVFGLRWYKHNLKLIEEFIEMLGTSILLVTFLRILMDMFPDIRLKFMK